MKRIIYSAIAIMVLASCATTANIENSWRDNETTISMSQLNKVLVVALFKNDVNRRAAESQLAGMLKGKGITSYTYLPTGLNGRTEEQVKQQLRNDGFDGAIVMRLADVEKEINYVQGSYPAYYGRFWPYFSGAWNAYYQPGRFETTKKFTIETNVYSLRKDKLVWSGLTSSVDPTSTEKLMKAVGREVYQRMHKDGFLVNN